MWPFSKEIKRFIFSGSYRIVPQYSGGFTVEQYIGHSYRGWEIPHSWKNESFFFDTEEQAERRIAEFLKEEAEQAATAKKVQDFKSANPPREVPPYKYIR